MTPLAQYLFGAMISWSPLTDHAYIENRVITEARYDDIATQIADQAMDPDEEPLFAGEDGRARTALLLAGIASYESGGFRADVHFCNTGGDSGRAWSLFQSHRSKEIVCSSVRNAAHVALEQIRESFSACHVLRQNERLSGYAAGDCVNGRSASRTRFNRVTDYWKAHPFLIQ